MEAVYWYNVTLQDDASHSTAPANKVHCSDLKSFDSTRKNSLMKVVESVLLHCSTQIKKPHLVCCLCGQEIKEECCGNE